MMPVTMALAYSVVVVGVMILTLAVSIIVVGVSATRESEDNQTDKQRQEPFHRLHTPDGIQDSGKVPRGGGLFHSYFGLIRSA